MFLRKGEKNKEIVLKKKKEEEGGKKKKKKRTGLNINNTKKIVI